MASTGRDGRNHLANLRVFGDHNAGKGRPDRAVVDRLLRDRNTGFGGRHLLLGELDFGFQAVGVGRGVVQCFLRLNASLLELLGAV